MLPANIDLTENRDFADPSFVGIGQIIPLDRNITELWELDNDEDMSFSEYKKLSVYEGIFGVARHVNQKRVVFKKDDEPRDTCYHCGKRLMPWSRDMYLGMCEKCRYTTSQKRFPWSYEGPMMSRARDLLSMR